MFEALTNSHIAETGRSGPYVVPDVTPGKCEHQPRGVPSTLTHAHTQGSQPN